MMTDALGLRVAGLLTSRLCHDLVGPLGAVSSGLELIAEDDAMAKEALALAQRHGLTKVFETARMYTRKSPPVPLAKVFGVTSHELG